MSSPGQSEFLRAESIEYLTIIDRSLERWESDPSAARVSDELLRALHSLKALASSMGYVLASQLAHALEDLVERLKASGNVPDQATAELLSHALDALRTAVIAPAGDQPQPQVSSMIAAVQSAARAMVTKTERTPVERWRVSVCLSPDAPMPAARALVVLQRAGELGKVVWVDPPESGFGRDDFGREFCFGLATRADGAAIEAAVRRAGDVEAVELSPAGVLPEPGDVRGSHAVRVEVARIESLTRLVAELRCELSGITALDAEAGSAELRERVRRISELLERLEEEVRAARVTAAWRLFDRFPRMVRHLARSLGKQVELVIRGRELEVDRQMLDQLGDPILHLIRNAVDHGIEPPGERLKLGKPAVGTVVLEALRSGSRLLIRVSDDGRGIDREKVVAIGQAMGLVDASAQELTDEELLRVLAHPGFTTAASPGYVSGRGIGVDVVTSRIGGLGGTVRLKSEPGRGCVFELDLPGGVP